MITEEQIDKLVERLVKRIEKANTYFLKSIGSSINEIKKLSPSEAYKLIKMLKYGDNYKRIVDEIKKQTDLNVKDIDKIFYNFAKEDQMFYEQFYKYRNIPFIPLDENKVLRQQTQAFANIVKNEMYDYFRSKVLGYSIHDILPNGKPGKLIFKGLKDTYTYVLDEAFLNISQGKDTFEHAMSRILSEIGSSGLKTVDYGDRAVRLDSVIRMHLEGRLRELHNELQDIYGEEFGADGYEISVHANSAVDHAPVQGRQFNFKEYKNLNAGRKAQDYKGNTYSLDHDYNGSFRPISELNCKHYIFSIVLGVSDPSYTDEELKAIEENNKKGFELDGKHYTMYEGTQLQRSLEREIRKQKDIQILARESDNKELILKSQSNITKLTQKYNELNKASGLPNKPERLKVSGYKRVKINKPVINKTIIDKSEQIIKVNSKEDLLEKWNKKFENDNIEVKHILKAEPKLIDKQITQVDNLLNKYGFVKDSINKDYETNKLIIQVNTGDIMGENNYARFFGGHYIEFNEKYFKDSKLLYENVNAKIEKGWWQKVETTNYEIYPVTHEYGHLLEFKMIEKIEHSKGYNGSLSRGDYMIGDLRIFKEISKQVPDIEKYISGYGKSTTRLEWFAETFTQMELGKETPLTKALKKYIDEFMGGNYEYFR